MPDTPAAYALPDTSQHPVVLFDGVCNLCNGSVNFILDRDPRGRIHFGALQSPVSMALLDSLHYRGCLMHSVLLVKNGRVYDRSRAALEIARMLSGGWPLLYGFMILPPFVRNLVYDWIARNRYRWFGKREACRMPTPDLKSRFLPMQ